MLQNRVDPLGRLIITEARGAWMGNRGVIHNEHRQIVRLYKHKAWITCTLEFKERRRAVMTPNRWTELFFLDEATAFAAGHRPCFECRKDAAIKFKACWIKGNPEYKFTMKTLIREIDEVIHSERIDGENGKVMYHYTLGNIPDGTFLLIHDNPFVVNNGTLLRWTPFGYDGSIDMPEPSMLTILTPRSIVNAFRAGYTPQIAVRG